VKKSTKERLSKSFRLWGMMLWFTFCVGAGVYGHVKGKNGLYYFLWTAGISFIVIGTIDHYYLSFMEKWKLKRRTSWIRAQNFPYAIEQLIFARKIRVGMTKDQVLASWGKPSRIKRTVSSSGASETYYYDYHTLRFEDDILTYWNKDDELIDNSEEVDPWLEKRSA